MNIPVVEQIPFANNTLAEDLRCKLDAPASSVSTSWLRQARQDHQITGTVERLLNCLKIGYVDGDIATSIDAERIAALDVPVVQINTGGNCHLDANMLAPAVDKLPLDDIDLMIVENVGNLICPANFQLGTHINVLVASVPEGDDKPYKYPTMYRGVDVLILNKVDLLPYIPFDVERFKHGVRVLSPNLKTFEVSSLHGDGMDAWVDWLAEQVAGER